MIENRAAADRAAAGCRVSHRADLHLSVSGGSVEAGVGRRAVYILLLDVGGAHSGRHSRLRGRHGAAFAGCRYRHAGRPVSGGRGGQLGGAGRYPARAGRARTTLNKSAAASQPAAPNALNG